MTPQPNLQRDLNNTTTHVPQAFEESLVSLYPHTVMERIKSAVVLVNELIANQDERFVVLSTRKIGKEINSLSNKLKRAKQQHNALEIRVLEERLNMYLVLLYIRKKLGNEVLLETPISHIDLLKMQRESYKFA